MGYYIGLPFQAKAWYFEEVSYGKGSTGISACTVSNTITIMRIDSGDTKKDFYTASKPTVSDFLTTMEDPSFHIEWVWQPNNFNSLATYCCNRVGTDKDLRSLCFTVAAHTCSTTTASWYELKGCKCKTFNFKSSRGNEYICSADFSVKSVITLGGSFSTTSDPGTFPVSTVPYARFNQAAHGIVWTGISDIPFFVTDSIDVTVNNNLTDYYDCDSSTKVASIPGRKTVTGSCDISLDYGGGSQWYNVTAPVDITTLVVTLNATTALDNVVTLTGGRFDNLSVEIGAGGEGMMANQPFTFKDIAFS